MKTLQALSGILFLIAFVPYIIAILRGETKPTKATWIIWAILDTITLIGMIAADTVNVQIVCAVGGAWTIALMSLKYGVPGWTTFDKVCLAGAVLAIILMLTTGNATFGIVISGIATLIGAFPTFVSGWKHPERENKLAWGLYWLSCILTVYMVKKWTLADATQPIVFMTIESVMMWILFVQPFFRRLVAVHN